MRPLRATALFVTVLGCNGGGASVAARPEAAPPSRAEPAASLTPPPKSVRPKPSLIAAASGSAPAVSASAAPAAPVVEAPPGMLPVPGGTFTMGADDEGEQDERPAHEVTVEGFLLDQTEVTNEAYRACVEAEACRPWRDGVAKAMKYGSDREFRHPKQPVVGVSWNDAKTYCEWKGKRLPTEAEWERAARGSDGRKYAWGNDPPDKERHGAFAGAKSGATVDVGSYPDGAGPYGHLDLAGNVWEWVEDAYDPYAYKRPTAAKGVPGTCEEILAAQDELRKKGLQGYTGTNPIPTECERVLRGGAFNYRPDGLRASNRVHHAAGFRILVAGFRCARDAR